MSSTGSPNAGSSHLTAKTRIRNAALDLYADFGEDATSMRAVAEKAGVTVGLVVHHYGTKDGLREAVEQRIVDLFADAIPPATASDDARSLAASRDAAVAAMLERNPAVIGYLRRAVLDPTGNRGRVLEMLTDLTAEQVASLRTAGLASTAHADSTQVIGVLVRQLGHLFLHPMVERTWAQLVPPHSPASDMPRLVIRVVETDP
ncbi:MAG: TetR/AcrR family transcriptional regulator [Actinobacteria bacterium]|nr:TetR/AcrR family transcriptional regulator [Actinomycetota bacterium]